MSSFLCLLRLYQWYSNEVTVLSFWEERFVWKTVPASFYGVRALLLVDKTRQWYRLLASPQALRKLWRSKMTPSDGLWGWLPVPSRGPCNELRFDEIQCPDITVTALAPRSSTQRHWGLAVTKVFSLVGFLFLGDCWIRSQVIYLASSPGWFVCVNVTRQKIFLPLLYGREAKKDQFKRAM